VWLFILLVYRKVVVQDGNFLLVFKLDLNGQLLFAEFALEVLPEVGRYDFSLSLDLLVLEPLS